MATTLERELVQNTTWQLISLDITKSNDIQNSTNVQLQWSYTNTITDGTNFPIGETLYALTQNIYVRAITIPQKGFLSITENLLSEAATGVKIIDEGGRAAAIGAYGELWATDVKNDILAQFSYGISDRETKNKVELNGGTVSIQEDNLATVSTGTAVDGQAEIESYNDVRYRPGHTVLAHFTALFTDPTAADSHQWIGTADGENGFALGFIDGNFAIMSMRAGIHTHTFEAELNGTVSLSEIDFTKINVFRITFGYLGVVPATFEILPKGESAFRTIHTAYYHGVQTQTHIELPYLPIKMSVTNTGNTTDCQIRSGSWQGGVMGFCQKCSNRPFAYPIAAGILTKQATSAGVVLAGFRSKATFQGFTNKIRSLLQFLQFVPYNPTEDVVVVVQLLGGVTNVGGVWAEIDADNSVLEVNTGVTSYTGGGVGLTLYATASSGQGVAAPTTTPADLEAEALGLFLDPSGEYAIIATVYPVDEVGTPTCNVGWSVNWTELF